MINKLLAVVFAVLLSQPLYSQSKLSILFEEPDSMEINRVIREWNSRQAEAGKWQVETEDFTGPRHDQVISFEMNGFREYAFISMPIMMKDSACGLIPLLFLHGGNDGFDTRKAKAILKLFPIETQNRITLIAPAFRGEKLVHEHVLFKSVSAEKSMLEYDADDALGLLGLCFDTLSLLNKDRLIVLGISRGANTALRLAARDSSILKTIVISPFTNAFHPDIVKQLITPGYLTKGRDNMLMQMNEAWVEPFLKKKITGEELRHELLLRSPGWFLPQYSSHILVIHGDHDSTVPVSQSTWLDSMAGSIQPPDGISTFQFYPVFMGSHAKLDDKAKVIMLKEFNDVINPRIIKIRNEFIVDVKADSYQWYLNGEPIPKQIRNSIVPAATGVYKVGITRGRCHYFSHHTKYIR